MPTSFMELCGKMAYLPLLRLGPCVHSDRRRGHRTKIHHDALRIVRQHDIARFQIPVRTSNEVDSYVSGITDAPFASRGYAERLRTRS